MDYNMLASFMHGVNSDEPLLNEGEVSNKLNFFHSERLYFCFDNDNYKMLGGKRRADIVSHEV